MEHTVTGTRVEKDSMGEMDVPAEALHGASTQRAVLNFPISGRAVPDRIIKAFAIIKGSAAKVNSDLDRLDEKRAKAIMEAAREIRDGLAAFGGLATHFPIDIFQTGSGTSTNMNVNEVIANVVCVRGHQKIGSSKDPNWIEQGGVHPNDHVNLGQSSNDTFPTAMHVAAAIEIHDELLPAVRRLSESLSAKARKWDHVVKIGRTHLQDATPIRLGQEFSGFAAHMRQGERRLTNSLESLCELALGGTAVGTGINTHPDFGRLVAEDIARETGIPFREAENHFEAQHHKAAIVEASGQLKVMAGDLSKIVSDLRLMGCGPRCGIGELKMPAVQPGSSIMPGKVNPVICEAVMMVCCQVMGNDLAVSMGGLGGVGSLLDLNVAMPMMAANLLDSIHLLTRSCHVLVDHLIDGPGEGLQVDEARCASLIEGSLAMCTSLVPAIGYDASAKLAYQAYRENKTIRELALEQNLLPADELDRLLDPRSMTQPS